MFQIQKKWQIIFIKYYSQPCGKYIPTLEKIREYLNTTHMRCTDQQKEILQILH